MASPKRPTRSATRTTDDHASSTRGTGDELQQQAGDGHPVLTTAQGIPVADNQNSLRATPRGPTLLDLLEPGRVDVGIDEVGAQVGRDVGGEVAQLVDTGADLGEGGVAGADGRQPRDVELQ